MVVDHVSASGAGNADAGRKTEPSTGLPGSPVEDSLTPLSWPSTTKCHGLPCQWL